MAKPWAKYEIGYLNHPKFLALNANAIVLWMEAKNYCDEQHSDGRFPKEALRTFRFSGHKAVELLTRSCGLKPNGDAYAPLWESQDIGGVAHYVMHDYLDHNDCRDEVLERLQDADERTQLRRLKDAKRKQEERARRRAEIAVLMASVDSPRTVTRTNGACPHPTEAAAEAVAEIQIAHLDVLGN